MTILSTAMPPNGRCEPLIYDLGRDYDRVGVDKDDHYTYSKLTKPHLPNHKLIDPEKENQRGLLLFPAAAVCPFPPRGTRNVLGDGNCLFRSFVLNITGSQQDHLLFDSPF